MTSGARSAATFRSISLTPTGRAGVAATIFFIGLAALLKSGALKPAAEETFTDLTFVALGLVYVPLAVRVARAARGRLKAAWVAMAISFAGWLLGETLWAYYHLVAHEPTSPSWADAAYLTYYVFACVALLVFPGAINWRSQAQMLLDAAIVTGSFVLVSWLTVLRPIWLQRTGTKLDLIVSLGYPVGDVLVVTLGVLILIRAAPGMRLTLSLLVAGLTMAALADSLWVYQSNTSGYSAGGQVDLLYFANSLLVIVALVAGYKAVPAAGRFTEPPGWLSRSLPLVAVVVAAAFVAVTHPVVVKESPVVITGVLVTVSLVLRQILEAAELGKRERQVRVLSERLSGELASAAKYVTSILPGDLDGPVRIRSRYLPLGVIGGDSYGYLWIDEDHLIVYVIDVSGHGVEPSLLSVSVHNMLRARSMPTSLLMSPEKLMGELNRLFSMEKHGEHYFTMWYGVYQASTRTINYVAAGHPPRPRAERRRWQRRGDPAGWHLPSGRHIRRQHVHRRYLPPSGRISAAAVQRRGARGPDVFRRFHRHGSRSRRVAHLVAELTHRPTAGHHRRNIRRRLCAGTAHLLEAPPPLSGPLSPGISGVRENRRMRVARDCRIWVAALATTGTMSSVASQAPLGRPAPPSPLSGWRRCEMRLGISQDSMMNRSPSTWEPTGIWRPDRSRCIARTTSTPAVSSNIRNCAPTRGLKSSR